MAEIDYNIIAQEVLTILQNSGKDLSALPAATSTAGLQLAPVLKTENGITSAHRIDISMLKGDTGAQGSQGVKGDKGDTGVAGPQGQKGDKGDTGQPLIVLPNGNYGNWDEELKEYVDTGIAAMATVDIENVPIAFGSAGNRINIVSDETIPTIFGKIKKWLSDLKNLAFKDKVDYTADIDNLPDLKKIATSGSYNDLTNKPTLPTKVSDLTNDFQFQTSSQVNTSITDHNTNLIAHSDIRTSIANAEAIARGKSRALVFDTVKDLDSWLGVTANQNELQTGDNFYIKATDVPDYWWNGSQKQPLEAEKVDLSNVYTIQQSDAHYVQKSDLKTVATTGSYNDLINKPVIPESTLVDFSTTEQWTGRKWIDGKKIYQKSFNHSPITGCITANIPNIAEVIQMDGMATDGYTWWPLPYPFQKNDITLCIMSLYYQPGYIYITFDDYVIKCFCTIYYTCTNR